MVKNVKKTQKIKIHNQNQTFKINKIPEKQGGGRVNIVEKWGGGGLKGRISSP